MELLRQWLKYSADFDLKHSFLASLISLLEFSDNKQHNEIVHRLFSNLKSPQTFPNIGKDSLSVNYLIEQTDVPYEAEEYMGLTVLHNLMRWPWGAQALLANTVAVQYIVSRIPKPQAIAQKRFEVVTTALEIVSKNAGIANEETVTKLLEYQSGGVYGENIKLQDAPIVEHETM